MGRAKELIGLVTASPWKAIDADTPELANPPKPGVDWRVVSVLVTVAVVLTLQEYFGDRGTYYKWFGVPRGDRYGELKAFAWWAGWRVGGYVLIPLVVMALMRERILDFNLRLRGFLEHLPLYLFMFAVFFPVLYAASHTASFQHTYPFYKLANRSWFDFVAWELLYVAQFFALEFFFRGYILHGLRHRFGAASVLVMMVPYCMIHYGKPLPETLGAVGAGILLGTVAMRTRSIWGGVLIHVAVAVSMDSLSLWHQAR